MVHADARHVDIHACLLMMSQKNDFVDALSDSGLSQGIY
jgi:hypothetical protein